MPRPRLATERGYGVCINYRKDAGAAEELAREIKAIAIQGDVASEADVERLFRTVDDKLGRVSVLVNNAGIVDRGTRVEQMSAERIQRMLAVNVLGSFLCAREAVKRMSTCHGGEGGAIVNVSSVAARLGGPGEYVDYAASKGAIDTFTIGLAKEVGRGHPRERGPARRGPHRNSRHERRSRARRAHRAQRSLERRGIQKRLPAPSSGLRRPRLHTSRERCWTSRAAASLQSVVYALLGPTASGKSALALQAAERLPLEIVSMDSALVYRGMDIGTANQARRSARVCRTTSSTHRSQRGLLGRSLAD